MTCGFASSSTRASVIALLICAIGVLGPAGLGRVHSQSVPLLSGGDVAAVLRASAEAIGDETMAIAVVDRQARILGVYARRLAGADTPDVAVTVARTAALFSNNQAPLSSRTVRFLSGIHFPAGVPNTPSGPLYGIENSNRGCQLTLDNRELFERARSIRGAGLTALPSLPCRPNDTSGCAVSSPIAVGADAPRSFGITTGKNDVLDPGQPLDVPVNPGGFALYRGGQVVGAVGVAGVGPAVAEYAAFVGAAGTAAATGLSPVPSDPLPPPGAILIEGFRLPFFGACTSIDCIKASIAAGPPNAAAGTFSGADLRVQPRAGQAATEGYILGPRASSQPGGLTAAEVQRMIDQGIARANVTRAQVRLPLTQSARVVISITDQAGDLLAIYRMADALSDAVDVTPAKARNAYYFSSLEGYLVLRQYVERSPVGYRWEPSPPSPQGWALTGRTLGFGGQPLFPPGIDLERTPKQGPWFDMFLYDTLNPCTEGPGPTRGGNRNFLNQNGIAWFPGSAPLYRGRELIGGIGVSGDGIEQNDYITAGAVAGFDAPADLRVDRSVIRTPDGASVRLPYWKFPRNPELR